MKSLPSIQSDVFLLSICHLFECAMSIQSKSRKYIAIVPTHQDHKNMFVSIEEVLCVYLDVHKSVFSYL